HLGFGCADLRLDGLQPGGEVRWPAGVWPALLPGPLLGQQQQAWGTVQKIGVLGNRGGQAGQRGRWALPAAEGVTRVGAAPGLPGGGGAGGRAVPASGGVPAWSATRVGSCRRAVGVHSARTAGG